MLQAERTRTCVVLLLLLSLLATPVLARPTERAAPGKEESVFVQLWHALGRLVPAFGPSMGTMDPNGSPLAPPPSSHADSRGTMDPNGAPTSSTDSHGTMDPDGR